MKLTIAGAFTWNLIPSILKYKLKRLDDITVYDGPNNCAWNGGRINRNIHIEKNDIDKYNKLGIKVALTFSNPIIDLEDPVGLNLLDLLSSCRLKNEIILINEPFRKFLRKNYNFILKFSITGHDLDAYPEIENQQIYKNYYNNLENKYDIIVPKMEHIFQDWFYNNRDLSKYEIMLNDTCMPNCPYYKQHFEEIARINTIFKDQPSSYDYNKNLSTSVEECWLPNFNPDKELTSCKTGMDLDLDLLTQAKELGYTRFKISGRENEKDDIINEIFKVTGMGNNKSM